MRRTRASRRAQRGLALIALLTVAVLAFAYVLTSRLNAASQFVGVDREHNAKALARAKQALIGWMALNAAGTDDDPGRLPCPEAPGDFGTVNEGRAAGSCLPPNNVGRLPWRTLGLEKLADANGEPLWYAVSPGWSLPGATTTPINSNSAGELTLDGAPNSAVALVFAPGRAMRVQAGAGCTAWPQARPVAGPPDVRNYLECGNAAANFVSASPGNTFNDQVLRVSTADLVPALEAAIASRMQREIAPALRGVYASAAWGTSATNPLYPFAARFDNPHPGSATYRGEDGRLQGLLPFSSSSATCGADPRCSATFVNWDTGFPPSMSATGGTIVSQSCSFPSASTVRCTGLFASAGAVTLRMSVRADNVAMALRTLAPTDVANMQVETGLIFLGPPGPGTSASGTFDTSGRATLSLNADRTGLGAGINIQYRITANLGVIADHALLDPASTGAGATGWFVRNEWYRLTYYAAAEQSTVDGLPAYGCTSSNCLRFNSSTTRNIRSLLILMGRSLAYPPAARPNNSLADYLEYQNVDLGTLYEQRPMRVSRVSQPAINAPFNDRIVLVDWIAPNPTFPLTPLP